jgi:TonB family protein
MGVDATALVQGDLLVAGAEHVPAQRRHGRGFWLGLAVAAILHVGVFVGGLSPSVQHRMGEKGASPEGISVDLVDESDLRSRSTVAPEPSPPPGQQNPPPREARQEVQPTPPAPPEAEPQTKPIEPPEKPTLAAKPEKAEPVEKPDKAEQPEKSTWEPATKAEAPSVAALPDAKSSESIHPPKPKETKAEAPVPKPPSPKAKAAEPPKPHQPLQLAMPALPNGFAGRAAAVSRPPGITRSGENDEFGRGVIRALRQTMPLPRDKTGRVTIRFMLTENGNIAQIQLVYSGGDPMLDQQVLFAAKQASFPLPPVGSTVADRTFLVTYVYR